MLSPTFLSMEKQQQQQQLYPEVFESMWILTPLSLQAKEMTEIFFQPPNLIQIYLKYWGIYLANRNSKSHGSGLSSKGKHDFIVPQDSERWSMSFWGRTPCESWPSMPDRKQCEKSQLNGEK